tara:strand:- start:9032 stop:9220 length:189 start_codon:yes stop_codon:yes gene_type:complete
MSLPENRYKTAYEELRGTLTEWEVNYEQGTFNDPEECLRALKQVLSDITDKYQFQTCDHGLE